MTKEISYQDKPWTANYGSGVPEHVDYEQECLPEFLSRSANRFPNKMALSFQGYEVNFSELNDMVNRFATCLRRAKTGANCPTAVLC